MTNEISKALDLLYDESAEPDMSSVKTVKMTAYEDIVVYNDGTEKVHYHYCD